MHVFYPEMQNIQLYNPLIPITSFCPVSVIPDFVQILINDRNYDTWTFRDPSTNLELPINDTLCKISPVTHKLFSGDVFSITISNGQKSFDPDIFDLNIIQSTVRTTTCHAGVLQLETNKTYGRTLNKKRLLYKCIPDDKRLPAFIIPYDAKIGFSKVQPNKYVIFKYDQWDFTHPQGLLVENLGNVGSLDAFYEYQLYCKSLHVSITDITNRARMALKNTSANEYTQQILQNPYNKIQDRVLDYYIFTIDPPNSMDFDDGFSLQLHPDNSAYRIVSVYIANIYVWLETLGLWNSFSQRVATIYLPDHRRPMLPTILSDALCSLQEGHDRFAFVMDVTVDMEQGIILYDKTVFSNAHIRVSNNYCYEARALLHNKRYQEFANVTSKLDNTIANSHDVVAFWMIQMNTYCANVLAKRRIGIFRSVTFNGTAIPLDNIVENMDTRRVIQSWNNTTGQYLAFSENAVLDHELMEKKSYVHITSPIRRLVDLLNQMLFSRDILGVKYSADAEIFLTQWMGKLDYINASMRSIRKVQTDCDLLCRCTTNPEMMTGSHSGIVFDKIAKNDGSGMITYMVYLEKWRLLSRITTQQDFNNYEKMDFKIFLFEDEDKTKRKIRLHL